MDRLAGGYRPYLLLSLLCLILYLPGLASVPPLDRDESRFVQATRQMLETGDYVRIQFQDEMRAKKPVGAYWLQAASVRLLSEARSDAVWPYRLPSALAAWVAALATFWFGRHLFGRFAALLGAALLASCVMVVAEAHQAKTDAVLLACAVIAQGALARFYLSGRQQEHACGGGGGPGALTALAFWLAQGAAILVKGPVVPAVSLLTILALVAADRRAGWLVALRPLTGMIVAAAVAAPWFAAVSQATGGAFLGEAVKADLLPKLLGAQESHGGLPGTYLLLASLSLWPASLLAWPAMVRSWRLRHEAAIRFCLAWIIPAWVMFELIPTKLPHYVLPTYPAIALLTAAAVVTGAKVLDSRGARLWYAAWMLIGLTLAAAVMVLPETFGTGFSLFDIMPAAGIALTAALPLWYALKRRAYRVAAVALVATGATAFPVVFDGVLPNLDKMWVSRKVATEVRRIGHAAPVAAVGYSEPSLIFLLGTGTRLLGAAAAAEHLAKATGALAVVAEPDVEPFVAAAVAQGYTPQSLALVKGFNYSRGKPVVLTVFARMRAP